ncbi:S1C family serine protease [Nonomuraea glycinis]|uniref:S1C family serine protease n=1 Tax=Nonomuraea glycinis TaxID=2047744 RepID=UPI0033BCC48C
MTDETRPTEGRTPSDSSGPQGRPEFLPVGGQPEPSGGPSGNPWGDPSGSGTLSHDNAFGAPRADTRAYEAPTFGEGPSFERPGGDGPAFHPPGGDGLYLRPGGEGSAFQSPGGEGPSFRPSGEGSSFQRPSGDDSAFRRPSGDDSAFQRPGGDGSGFSGSGPSSGAAGDGPVFGSPSGEGPGYGNPSGETQGFGGSRGDGPVFGNPSGETQGLGSPRGDGPVFGSPGGPNFGTAEWPFFGNQGRAGGAPPPPPNALGMGPTWGPPPPGSPGGATSAGRRGPSTAFLVVLATVIALTASLLGSAGTYLLTRPSAGIDPSYSLPQAPTGATDRAPDSVAGVASRVLPSVVSLEVGNGGNTEAASGSGFLIKDGYVVTNNHVVALAAKGGEIKIVFNNRKTTTARIVGRDPGSDLAVVKPEETFGTPEARLGNSDQVVVGDPVIAIGSPLGLTGTVTTGIVSSLNRPVIAGDETGASGEEPAYISAIQTDAAINPGNSGGPLVNGNGEVIGVNSAIATLSRSLTSQSGSIGLGFAIPVNQARRVAQELVTTGKAKRPKIGIVLDREYRGEGVRIATGNLGGRPAVDKGGPAHQAGLKAGDVIVEVDNVRLQDGNELIALIRSKAPGAKLTIKYERDNEEHTATLTVSADEEPAPTPS